MARSSLFIVPALALALSATLVSAPATAKVGYPTDPAADLALPRGAFGAACTEHPMRRTCERIMIRALNHARSVLDQPAYHLPARFGALRARAQLLVLANSDRKLYRRIPVAGLNPTLNASAERGADRGGDPAFVPVGGKSLAHGGSNWAGGLRSPLAAYFVWMYADAGSDWMHRHNVLMPAGDAHNVVIMGVGSTPEDLRSPDWTMLLESFAPSPVIECVPTLLSLSVRTASETVSSVLLFGFGFLHVRQVTFGGVPAAFTRTSLFAIRAVPPPHAAGRVYVRVVTTGGTSDATAAAVYTY